ncbi:MAG: hypothetical protein JGK17_09580 [Microcoleus sp. PH2017_10_PVI_O_A]|uniref:hypothetical protein n=1 Tax=unclassified Microcoleus TaxID=2642155 RepID=UPI001D7D2D2B|nr:MULTISPECIES: hypothetical protein [unclassified Microcoleus]TAE80530.1 MAG: hypothetical protein EAZ83_17760 [Oscillatoriales cyanobacterium]MCC3405827.1 hypothetical protein [Microcoleus sp. PH2017_10_PVI_O_A]MCC3459866.1 hypothetical protein [Microcoleus sp. PH2017_11_PCY_U_A]MCC3478333.1 hypothetical protein [Microcoleus sp. PH2017_12_PCY_D_A]MCC3528804.1 hypothetical protein [Microcoleus sp. PH2017_21_RUC_O_A]
MFDISFYSAKGEPSDSVRITAATYEWLAKSAFSKIGGESIDTQIYLDEENVILPLVELNQEIRQQLKKIFSEAIISESDVVLTKLGDSPSKEEYQSGTYRLRKMLELLKCVENENYQYLQRI